MEKSGQANIELLKALSSGLKRIVSEICLGYRTISLKSGFCWMFGFIVVSIIIARFIFLSQLWKFSWMPAGLASSLAFSFVTFYLVIGPACIMFFDVLIEIKKKLQNVSHRPPLSLVKDFAKDYFTVEYLTTGVIAYCLLYGMFISYTNLKPAIPLLNHNLYDELLFQCDQSFLKVLSLGGLIRIPRNSTVTLFFDTLYPHMWTLASITLVAAYRNRLQFWRFLGGWCLVFGFSVPISVLFPSLGPAFYKPELFAYIDNTISSKAMQVLWKNYLSFKTNPIDTTIFCANGIVAMPSLHIALAYQSIYVLGKIYTSIKLILWILLILYFIATMYLGWHYFLDGVAGILLGWLAYKVSTTLFSEKIAK